jgi:xylan 1,4-beta-xylosidase
MVWGQAPHPRAAEFQNPLFAGDYADPSILRVGGDFYITHTSYRYAPGLVAWHSRDLVNWTPISHALNDMHGTHTEVWAPELVYHEGRYFIYFPMGGIYVVHAEHPSGPWSAPINLKVDDIDPGHVVGPDGKRYLYTAGGHAVELSPDGLSTVGERLKVYEGWQFPQEWKTEGFWLESPKLTRRGEYYYLACAEGGASGPPTSHMAVVARSKSPLGPWENSPHNPLIHTYSAEETWWSVGHGTLVSTPDDRWYIVYHGYRNGLTTLGRHTLMEPVEWTPDGWPVAPLGARRGEPMPAPMGIAQRPMIELSDNFRAPSLKATWGAWDETDMSRFGVGRGALTMRAKGTSPGHSSPLTIMARDASYQVQVTATPQNGCGAAMGLFYGPEHWLFAELKGGQLRVFGAKETLTSRTWKAGTVHLKALNHHNRVDFLASENGRDWQLLAAGVDASGFNNNALHGFQSLRPALAASGVGNARFADFSYRTL